MKLPLCAATAMDPMQGRAPRDGNSDQEVLGQKLFDLTSCLTSGDITVTSTGSATLGNSADGISVVKIASCRVRS